MLYRTALYEELLITKSEQIYYTASPPPRKKDRFVTLKFSID